MYMFVPHGVLVHKNAESNEHPVAFPTPPSMSACEHIRPPSFKHFRSASGWFFQVKHLSTPFLNALSDSPQALPTTVQPSVAQFDKKTCWGGVGVKPTTSCCSIPCTHFFGGAKTRSCIRANSPDELAAPIPKGTSSLL